MKKIILIALAISSLFYQCRQPIIIPVVGAVEGKIVNIHNEPIIGAEVTITHVPASESSEAEERTISTTTDFEGKYLLEDIWDEFRIDVEKSGFRGLSEHHVIKNKALEQVLDFEMIGSPETAEIILSKSILSESDSIDLNIIASVEDEFNEESTGYSGNLHLTDSQGILQSSIPFSTKAEGIGQATLEVIITSGSIASGVYNLSATILDPDGNQLTIGSDQQITIE